MTSLLLIPAGLLLIVFFLLVFIASRYRRCPSDRILVVYGKIGKGRSARCIHGGGSMVWPVIQNHAFLSLTPMTINIPLKKALSLQNIRIDVPSTFTVGISTQPAIMGNAAERLLHLPSSDIEEMAGEIIFGQLRLTVASLTIEQINQDRESFLEQIRQNVEPELNKIGLYLINVNITDITDESNYIESIGKKAAAEAINKAVVDVADQEKKGAIGEAEATREKEIRVAENIAKAEKGKKTAEADRRAFVQAQEADAVKGENDAQANIARTNANLAVERANAEAQAEKGKKTAEAGRRVFVQAQEADAVRGENEAQAAIARANADLAIERANADERGEVARRRAMVEIQKAHYLAEQERLNAEEVVREEVSRRKVEIAADAEAEQIRRVARGQADAVLAKYEAESQGVRQLLESKAAGYEALVNSCHGDARSAATLLLIEKMEEIVARQVEAIKQLKIDKITVWDSGGADGRGSSTANFVSNLIRTLPPLQELSAMAGVELPDYLGRVNENMQANQKPTPAEDEHLPQTTPDEWGGPELRSS